MGAPVKELLVKELAESLGLKFVVGEAGLDRELSTSRIQKPGLLLTGLLEELHPDRLQIFGAAELGYISSLDDLELERVRKLLVKTDIPAIVVTRGLTPPDFLVHLCEEQGIPLFTTPLTSSVFIEGVVKHLEERLAPQTMLHGVLVDVLGMGILITGKSGIGKSECALDLVSRGFRLVADDVVVVRKMPRNTLYGTSKGPIRYHMEIRGLGIVNIKDLYGITAIRQRKQMDLVVELVKWEPEAEYERLGFEENKTEILGVGLPCLKVPVSPGRSVATIVEVAARNQILKIMGHHSARDLEQDLDERLRHGRKAGS